MPEITPSRYLVTATWDDVPHLDGATKEQLLSSMEPHLRDARSKGVPTRSSGSIYPISFDDIKIEPFAIPAHWPRAYGLDVGWKKTAAIWGAWDPADGGLYLYAEHYRGKAQPMEHAAAIKARGEWIKGVIDPAARGRGQADGKQLLVEYKHHGLILKPANNTVESALHAIWSALGEGRIRVFTTLKNFESEYNLYRRDEDGKVVKEFDHLMDAFRYLWMSGKAVASVKKGKSESYFGGAVDYS